MTPRPGLQAYDPGQPLVFLHVPRTAGTSLVEVLRGWFPGQVVEHYRRAGRPPHGCAADAAVVVGHFNRLRGFGLAQACPQARQFLTVLRDPFDRFVSQWRYLGARNSPLLGGQAAAAGFPAWFEARAAAYAAGADDFAMAAQLPGEGRSLGDGYVAAGVTERLSDTLAVFAARLDRPPLPAMPVLNRSDPGEQALEPWRAAHRRAFAPEYALYAQAEALLEEGLAGLGPAQRRRG